MLLLQRGFDLSLFGRARPIGDALDALGFSPAGAWSVARRLRSRYSGPLLRVRRSSDNAEQDIGYRGDGALDSAALLAFCGAGSGFAAKVYDQGGGAYDMVQATAGSQPRIVNSGALDTMGAAGRPALNFIGGTRCLDNAAFSYGPAATVNAAAVTVDAGGDVGNAIAGNPTANNGRVRLVGDARALLGASADAFGTSFAAGTAVSVSAAVAGVGAGVAGRVRVNGAQQSGASTTTRGAPSAGASIGAFAPGNPGAFSGKVAEVIAWQANVSDAVLSVLERDQGRHFGIAVA